MTCFGLCHLYQKPYIVNTELFYDLLLFQNCIICEVSPYETSMNFNGTFLVFVWIVAKMIYWRENVIVNLCTFHTLSDKMWIHLLLISLLSLHLVLNIRYERITHATQSREFIKSYEYVNTFEYIPKLYSIKWKTYIYHVHA